MPSGFSVYALLKIRFFFILIYGVFGMLTDNHFLLVHVNKNKTRCKF